MNQDEIKECSDGDCGYHYFHHTHCTKCNHAIAQGKAQDHNCLTYADTLPGQQRPGESYRKAFDELTAMKKSEHPNPILFRSIQIPLEEKTEGIKHDQDKPQMALLSSVWIEGVARVLTFGASKYNSHNWRKGIAQSRLLNSTLRHVFAYLGGEDVDSETGLSHLYHASCCLMFLSELRITRPDLDDRYRVDLGGSTNGREKEN